MSKLVDMCNVTRYINHLIKSFRHAGLEKFFRTGSKAGIQPSHAKKLSEQLAILNVASKPSDMGMPGWKLHPLAGELNDRWSVWINGNWRLTFRFEEVDAILVIIRTTTRIKRINNANVQPTTSWPGTQECS